MILKNFNTFVNENMAMAKSIVSKKMDAFEKLKDLLSKNIGYIGKFTDYLMYENISYEQLENLYKQLSDLKSRNVNLDISNLKYEDVIDEIQKSYDKLSINSLVSQFPAVQKGLLKELLYNRNGIVNKTNFNTILKVSKKENIENFISKISRYKTVFELENALKIFSKDPINNRETIKKTVDGLDSKIVVENENIMIIYVPTFHDIKILAPDSSWCIVHGGMWGNYTRGRYQFILLSFNKDEYDPNFKIGFTLKSDGTVYACHDILDNSAGNILMSILQENNIKTQDLVYGDYSPTEPINLDDIKLTTTLTRLKALANGCTVDEASKLLVKLLDVYNIGKERPNNMTDNKNDVILSIIDKVFSAKIAANSYITEAEVNAVDPRLIKFILPNPTTQNMSNRFKKCFVINSRPTFYYLNDEAMIKGLDIWSDKSIVDYSANISESAYLKPNNTDFTKPIKDTELLRDKKLIIKLSDKLNKIYTSGIKFHDDKAKNKFMFIMLFFNCLLNRRDKCPDIDNIIVPNYMNVSYPGLFSKEISPDNGLNFYSFTDMLNYPINLIKKKDYNDAVFSFTPKYLNKMVDLVNHLEEYNLTIKATKETLEAIKDTSSTNRAIVRMKQALKNFNRSTRKSTKFKIDKLTLIVD